ncbi:C-type lectin-related protein 4 [Elysia marginata]|uniref:C-type lectin-related protein 4 n=1 Tax=Elysia marginata TaxID=1093978 RepID=A0AAV4EUE6_9GAST|nr:C-type lectin-related protein 4 [Elysia marginata]
MYNSNTGLCTLGSFLKSGEFGIALAPNSTEGDLFALSSCDTRDGFSWVTSGSLSACIMIPNFKTNYFGARKFCLDLGAHLYVSRSIEGFYLLPNHTNYIIGLTDIASEGTFVWEDSGTEITEDLTKLLFRPGEPNNAKGEHCVVVRPNKKDNFANDFNCKKDKLNFACQRPIN